MGIWKMSQLKAPPLTDDPAELRKYILYLSNQLASMLKDLDFTLNGDVDFRNVRAKSIKADNLNVTELSAITANMGKLTSGEIYGAYISTREAAFPRAEINDDGDLLAVYTDANNSMTIEPGITNSPNLVFTEGGNTVGFIGPAFGLLGFQGSEPMVVGTDTGSLNLIAGTYVSVPSWSKFINSLTGLSLQSELDSLSSSISSLSSAIASLDSRVSALESP